MKRTIRAAGFGALALSIAIAAAGSFATSRATGAPAGQDADDPGTHYRNAKQLYSDKQYEAARQEVNRALKIDPNYESAKFLKRRIEQALAAGGSTETQPAPEAAPATQADKQAFPVLTDAQVTRLRFFELGRDEQPRGSAPRKAMEDFWDHVIRSDPNDRSPKARDDRERFLSPSNFPDQVARIREQEAYQYVDKIKLNNDPKVIVEYRNRVQPVLLQNCATAGCHAGQDYKGFKLYGSPSVPPNTQQTYTNFLILNGITTADGGEMINRAAPEESLFLQYLLAKSQAKYVHPGKPLRPIYSGVSDTRYQAAVDWVRSLRYPTPDYGITEPGLPLPGSAGPATATQPAR